MAETNPIPDQPVAVTYQVKITPRLILAIVGPYVGEKFMEQVKALGPVAVFLFLFQIAVLRSGVVHATTVTLGLTSVVLGLMFFIEGLRLGVMPLGENIGATLPAKAKMAIILGVAFLLGDFREAGNKRSSPGCQRQRLGTLVVWIGLPLHKLFLHEAAGELGDRIRAPGGDRERA